MKANLTKTMSLTLIFIMLFSFMTPLASAASGSPFKDVPANASYIEAVRWAHANGIIMGSGGKFNPKGAMTRGDFCLMLWRMEKKPNPATAGGMFKDMKNPSHSQFKAITWANENGILLGSGGYCYPKNRITRDQMATMLYRYNVSKAKITSVNPSALNLYTDRNTMSGATQEHMRWAVTHGIIRGSGNKLNPKGTATREAAVTVLYRYYNVFGSSTGGSPGAPPQSNAIQTLAAEIVRLTNIERAKYGLPALIHDKGLLTDAAMIRAEEITRYWSHTRPDRKSKDNFWEAYYNLGGRYRVLRENLAKGYSTPAAAVQGWMNSKTGHRESILNTDCQRIGVGIALDSKGNYHWVQLFHGWW